SAFKTSAKILTNEQSFDLLEIMNGAEGISDIEHVAIGIARVDGNAARVADASTGSASDQRKVARAGDERVGERASFNGAEGINDIEGKVTRLGASERGQRMSFNGAAGR